MKNIFLLVFLLLFPNLLNAKTENNSKKPIDISSEKVIIYRDKQEIVFLNKVVAKQAKFTLYADKMITKYNKNDIETIKTEKNVQFISDKTKAKGDIGFYDLAKNTITLQNHVFITENNLTLMAESFEYNVQTGKTKITGSKNENDKVTIILDDDKK
ncbi:MAG TPA: LptA/OstA family protein [Rickettsiales bacterium]|nr:LptA/OstA family protein [Rickettsiales bacterium]